jgi:conjugative relaxase-like TrwC/TraI family protein
MLRIHTVTSAADAKRYYAAADYYKDGVETVGRWGGKLAERLGLSGTVDKANFELMCDNLRPDGSALTPRTNEERRVGYDMVFSGPKSFSIVEALADAPERLRLLDAFDGAIAETMEEIEADMQTRDRKDGADVDRTTGNLVYASFDHSTSRPVEGQVPDMHRHKHVLCFNATFDPVEHRIKAGQFANIKRDGEYFTASFYARLAVSLEAMGYAIDRRGGKAWEIAGVSQSMIDTFSKRTDEIEDEARRRGVTDADRKAELGAKTRAKKQKQLTPDQLRNAWRDQLTDGERNALAAVYRKEIAPSRQVTAAEAVAYAIAHGSEQLSVLPEREFKRLALLHGLGHLLPDQVMAELPRHGILARDIDGRRMATTETLLAEERGIVGFAANGRGEVRPVGVPVGLSRTLADGKSLNDGQWNATLGLLNSSNRINVVEGPAGAGKSYLLRKFDEGMRLARQKVTYLATTTDAVGVLQKDGFDVKTLAHFLLDERAQKTAKGGIVVIDESSLLGHRDAVRLIEVAKQQDLKLIFIGDAMQHGSVARGALMRVLKEHAGIAPFKLTEIRRQENAGYLAAVKLLSEGQTAAGFDGLDRLGWVKEIADAEDRYRHIAADYLQALTDKKTVICISPTHREAARITQEIRAQLRDAGKLGKDESEFSRLVAVNASEAERGLATTYRPGDVIQYTQNAKGRSKGDRIIVSDPAAVPLKDAGKFQLYRPEKIALAVGDAIRFTTGVKTLDGKHKLTNGIVRTVAGFTAKGIMLDNGWVVSNYVGHLRHGFVETSFGSQGKTVQRAIVAISSDSLPATNQEQMYVSSSRAKERMTLYTDDKEAVKHAARKGSQKLAALDLVPNQAKPPLPERQRRKRRLAIVERMRAAFKAYEQDHQHERQVSRGR